MAVTISTPAARRRWTAPLRALVAHVLRREERRAGEIGLRLTDDAELRALNRRWRRIDRATDVISFAYDEDAPDAATRPVAGDLVVSLDRVREQAKRYRVSEGAELARLVIHGVLHLAGHDHARAAERRAMRAREESALRSAKPIVRRMEGAGRGAKAVKPFTRRSMRTVLWLGAALAFVRVAAGSQVGGSPRIDSLRASMLAADSVEVSRLELGVVSSPYASMPRPERAMTRPASMAHPDRAWMTRFVSALLPPQGVVPGPPCNPGMNAPEGERPWFIAVRWRGPESDGRLIVDMESGCASGGRAADRVVSFWLMDEQSEVLLALLERALPTDAALAHLRPSLTIAPIPRPARPFDEGGAYVDVLPQPITRVPPDDPDSARAAGIEGTVQLRVLVDRDGKVVDAKIVKSIPALDSAALASVRKWTFKPATSKGTPVAVWIVIPVEFPPH